jgi:hypothetical protein
MKISRNDPRYSRGYNSEYCILSPANMIIMRNRKREAAYNNLPIGLNKYNNITLAT